jgi:NAD(P)-dependent dehydrogenase (short-subunit alcohol dehydrogenase family)
MTTVLITGTNKGVGLEMAKICAARGDNVIACCRNPDSADQLKAIEGGLHIHRLAVGDDESVAALAEQLKEQPIDVLINNAGTMGPEPKQQTSYTMDFEGWSDTFNINAMGPVRVMQALLPNLRMSAAPKVITISSQMGALSLDMVMAHAYCASKAAVNKFMRLASFDLKKEGIAVGLVHPGWVRTDMGGPKADLSANESAIGCISVTDALNLNNTGGFWKWDGQTHDW